MTTAEIETSDYRTLCLRREELTQWIAPSDRRAPSAELAQINRRLVQIEQALIAERNLSSLWSA